MGGGYHTCTLICRPISRDASYLNYRLFSFTELTTVYYYYVLLFVTSAEAIAVISPVEPLQWNLPREW